MNVTIHQPSYLPWIPFLEKGLRSDAYVLLDDVQYEKNDFINRNRIKSAQGELWLTVPVTHHSTSTIAEVQIATGAAAWQRKHRRSLEENYRRAPFFDSVAPPLFEILEQAGEHLLDLNLALDRLLLDWAGFEGRIVLSSELPTSGAGSQRIVNLCRHLGAKRYFAGTAGRDYLDLPSFAASGIEVVFQGYEHLPYAQQFPACGFVPYLSAVDLFMNLGPTPAAREAIDSGARWETAGGGAAGWE